MIDADDEKRQLSEALSKKVSREALLSKDGIATTAVVTDGSTLGKPRYSIWWGNESGDAWTEAGEKRMRFTHFSKRTILKLLRAKWWPLLPGHPLELLSRHG